MSRHNGFTSRPQGPLPNPLGEVTAHGTLPETQDEYLCEVTTVRLTIHHAPLDLLRRVTTRLSHDISLGVTRMPRDQEIYPKRLIRLSRA